MNYSDQLKSPKWQKKRLDILNLRGFKCEKCNCEENQLHVHHRFYLKNRKAWEYDNDVFQVLCYICHENEHKKEEPKKFDLYDYIYEQLNNIKDDDKEVIALEHLSLFNQFIKYSNNQANYQDLDFDISYIHMILFIINNGCKRDKTTICNIIEIMFNSIYNLNKK